MNYLHAFHAGNFADTFKHAILTGLIEALKNKASPFSYIDTHAGSGRYDLQAAQAERTGEYKNGILRLLNSPQIPLLSTYLDLVRALNSAANKQGISIYPGSPLLVSQLMRNTDQMQLCELQPEEAKKLKALFQGNPQIKVHARDGYAALKSLLPAKPPRGLILIDPPFEAQEDEFRAIESALEIGLERWPNGIYAAWYPIKLRQTIKPFHRWLKFSRFKKVLIAELLLHRDNSTLRLNGCGMAIINAPWQFDRQLEQLLPVLVEHLAQSEFGQYKLEWLVNA